LFYNVKNVKIEVFCFLQPVFRLGSVIGISPVAQAVMSLLPATLVLAPATFPSGTEVLI
jgi:hypothetical protein